MDDISPQQFTAMDEAASVASYARPLLICDDRNCGNLGCSPRVVYVFVSFVPLLNFGRVIAFVRTRKKHDRRTERA
jgi:hypothetical protein